MAISNKTYGSDNLFIYQIRQSCENSKRHFPIKYAPELDEYLYSARFQRFSGRVVFCLICDGIHKRSSDPDVFLEIDLTRGEDGLVRLNLPYLGKP